jgi:hypothetical protein
MKKSNPYVIPTQSISVEEAKKIYWPKDYVPKASSTVQVASMQATLDRDPSQDAVHWNRQIDVEKAQVFKTGEESAAYAEQRKATYGRNADHVESTRRRSKNTQGTDPDASATTPEQKAKAVHAFTVSPPATPNEEELRRLKTLTPIIPYIPEPVKEKPPEKEGWSVMELINFWKKD